MSVEHEHVFQHTHTHTHTHMIAGTHMFVGAVTRRSSFAKWLTTRVRTNARKYLYMRYDYMTS